MWTDGVPMDGKLLAPLRVMEWLFSLKTGGGPVWRAGSQIRLKVAQRKVLIYALHRLMTGRDGATGQLGGIRLSLGDAILSLQRLLAVEGDVPKKTSLHAIQKVLNLSEIKPAQYEQVVGPPLYARVV